MALQTQTLSITETPRPRRWFKLVFLIFLLFLAWSIAVPTWDYYVPYSGVVLEKGMDCNLCWFGRRRSLDLYVLLQDDRGKRSKRYVETSRGMARRWNAITVGSFIVKDKGWGEFPYEPGKKPSSRPASASDGWLLLAIIVVCGTVIGFQVRQLWKLF